MALNEKEKTTIKDLQTQEQTCIKKYKKYKKRLRLRIYRLRSRPVSRSTRSMDRMLKILC